MSFRYIINGKISFTFVLDSTKIKIFIKNLILTTIFLKAKCNLLDGFGVNIYKGKLCVIKTYWCVINYIFNALFKRV